MDLSEYDLVTFGCSFTYGHGLHDCIDPDGQSHGPLPSVLAWPNQLKSISNFKTVDNVAEPGASNKLITKYALEYKKYTKKSFVIIYWSNFDRHTVFYSRQQYDRLHMMPAFLSAEAMPQQFWDWQKQQGDVEEFKRKTLTWFSDFHFDFDVYWEQVVRMNYVDAWFRSKGIECRHLFGEHEWNKKELGSDNKKYFNKYMLKDIKVKTFHYQKDFHIDDALDKPYPHPGMASHKHFAHNIKKWFKL